MAVPETERRRGKAAILVLIGALYLSQGIPMGLAFVAMPAILRTMGVSVESIGLLGLVTLPWAIKFLWAPSIDRRANGMLGPRRSWIVPAQAVSALLFFVIAILVGPSQTGLTIVIALLLVINTVSATQDIATDGLAVDCLHGRQIAWVNGLQIGAFAVGMMIGGSVTIILFDNGGWRFAFIALGALMLITCLIAIYVKEPPRPADHGSNSATRPSLLQTWRRPGVISMLIVAALFQTAHTMVGTMNGPFLVDAGLSLTEIGVLSGSALTGFAAVGALIGSFIAGRIGAPLSAIICGTLAAASLVLWLAPAHAMQITFVEAITITGITSVLVFAAYASFFAVLMQWASPEQAGTDFTVMQCSETLAGMMAAIAAGQLAGSLGFKGFFVTVIFFAFIAMAWIAVMFANRGLFKPLHREAINGANL